jgi:hypothetical protein
LDALVFAPKSGSTLDKTFTLEHQLVVQKMKSDGDDPGQISQQGLEVATKIELLVADTYVELGTGRPLKLQRLFKSSGMHVDLSTTDAIGEKHPDSWDAESPLKGKSVVFTWVPEEKVYGRYYDQLESLEEYLAGLSEDLDFRLLLSDREVHQGSDWTIDPARFVDLFVPGGNIALGFVKGGSGTLVRALTSGVGGPLYPVFGGIVKGNARASWKETREVEGDRLAVIELAISIETDHDRTEAARAAMHQEDSPDVHTIQQSTVRWKFEGSGTLLWNLSAQRFETLDLVGREDVTSELALALGSEVSRQVLSMAGSLKVTARAVAKKK